jgi:hypothetical protein
MDPCATTATRTVAEVDVEEVMGGRCPSLRMDP